MRRHHFLSNLVPSRAITFLGSACALSVLLFLGNNSLAENKLLATEVSNAEGWREYHIAVDAQGYAWCGPGTKLVVDTKKDGIKLIDVATWKVQEISKGSNPVCSEDGKFIYFRVVQPGSVKFVQITMDSWTRREFDAPVYGTIQISANGRYVFFTSSGIGQKSGDGLYYLDVPSGKVFTIHKQRLPTFKSDHHVSPGNKYFVAPPGWEGKSVTLSGGEKLTAIPLPIAPSGDIFDQQYMTEDWVWTPDDRKLVTLTRHVRTQKALHTKRAFLVRVYDLPSGRRMTSMYSQEGSGQEGFYYDEGLGLQSGVGNKVYLRAEQKDGTGAQLLQLDLDRETSEQIFLLKSIMDVDFSPTGLIVYSKRFGAKVHHHDTELSKNPNERFISILVIDEKGRETSIRTYPFESNTALISGAFISRDGLAIALSKQRAAALSYKDFSYELVVLKRK